MIDIAFSMFDKQESEWNKNDVINVSNRVDESRDWSVIS